jgi:transposase InsO family protein
MMEFEETCKGMDIPLIVLPPANPKYNGGVERNNRVFREEFYDDVNMIEDPVYGIRGELLKEVDRYNTYRPHHGLQELTPMEYPGNLLEAHNLSQRR